MIRTLLLLFAEFFKTGLFALGGGLATIPFLTEMQFKYPEWFSQTKLADMIAIAESTPGPIGVNTATYCGFSAAGLPGSIVSTCALVLPSLIIITIISKFYEKYKNSSIVNHVFLGIRPAVTGLIASAGYSVFLLAVRNDNIFDWRKLLFFGVILSLLQIKAIKKIHPIAFIGLGAFIGIIFGL